MKFGGTLNIMEVTLRYQRLWFVLTSIFYFAILGCDVEGTVRPTSSSSGAGGSGSSASSGSTSSGSTSASSSSTGGNSSFAEGAQATDFVSSGDTVRSGQYTLVFTIGQSTPSHRRTKSMKYTHQGGVVGTTESLK